MKIVYCTDQVYLHGGIEKVMAQKINYLVNNGYEVHLITTEQKGKPFCYHMNDELHHHDLEVNYDRKQSYFTFSNLKKIPTHFLRLKRKLKEINPDIIIVCNYTFDFYFVPILEKKVKTIREYHASRYYTSREKKSTLKKIKETFINFFEKKYTSIVVLNKDEEKYYNTNNIKVIPNSIEVTEENKVDFAKREKIILAAGRIAPVKQFDHLIRAWEKVYNKYPDWNVHIYGEGDLGLKRKLENIIVEKKIKNIHFKGVTNQLNEKMNIASLYALTSSTECFPMVLLESLSHGLPILSYKSPHGPENIITDNEDGILVELNNINEFALRLERLINNKEKRKEYSKKGYENIKRFEEVTIMKKWEQLFNS